MCGVTIRNHTREVIGVNADVPRVMLSVLSSLWRTLTLLNLHEHSMRWVPLELHVTVKKNEPLKVK